MDLGHAFHRSNCYVTVMCRLVFLVGVTAPSVPITASPRDYPRREGAGSANMMHLFDYGVLSDVAVLSGGYNQRDADAQRCTHVGVELKEHGFDVSEAVSCILFYSSVCSRKSGGLE
jgi:hypothetical protein